MTFFQALFLGFIQGATEFLPISSSGHLIILPKLFGWDAHPLVFDTILHLGTGLAIVVYFWKELWYLIKKDRKFIGILLVGSFPAAVLGVLLNDLFENYFRNALWVALFLVLGSILIWCAQEFSKPKATITDMNIGIKKTFSIGVFQALALFPGFSRSGATISGGMLLGLKQELAAKFSFLLSIPIIFGAGLFQISDSLAQVSQASTTSLLGGFIASFISGILCIAFLMAFLKKHSLRIFVLYRVVLAGVIIATLC